ncbi:MAG: InlB B-repeat-containing protein, partial [Bifidobacteriaceae bacterium]|nr:InlB B-repeat-containing protein [Bifidobacteriaceae bacterium]
MRLAGDENHQTSTPVLVIPKVYTSYQPPVWDDVLQINYQAETIEFKAGYNPGDYEVTVDGAVTGANGSLTALADKASGGSIGLKRQGTSDPTQGPQAVEATPKAVAGRPAAPDTNDFATSPAKTPNRPTGVIVELSATTFEYRLQGAVGTWKQVTSGQASNVAYGTYTVRYPATAAAFASAPLTLSVGAETVEYEVTWITSAAGEAAVASLVAEEVGVGPLETQPSVVAGGDTVKFTVTAAAAVPDSWLEFRWNAGGADVVHTAEGSAAVPTDQFETPPVTSNTQVSVRVGAWFKRSVSYLPNGAEGTIQPTANTAADPDYDVTLSDGTGFSRSGYRFMGWNTQADGQGQAYESGAAYTMTDTSLTLHAQWASTAAKLLSLSGQTVKASGGDGSQASPYQAAVGVANAVTAVTSAAADVSNLAAVALYTDSAYTTQGTVTLATAGQPYHAYVKVTAEDGLTITYWDVAVTRAKSADKTLYSLAGQTFKADQAAYTVDYGVAGLSFGEHGNVLAAPLATVTLNGAAAVNLAVGENAIAVVVTAEDGSNVTYNLTVTRQPSGEVKLVAVGGAEVVFANPDEDGSGSSAGAPVAGTAAPTNSVTELTDGNLATETDSGATASLWNSDFTSPVADPVALVPSVPVVIFVKVTSGVGDAYYQVTVTRQLSTDASLYSVAGQDVSGQAGPLEITVPYAVTQITAADVVAAPGATVQVTGEPVALTAGTSTVVMIEVTPPAGALSAITYQVNVTRSGPPNQAPVGLDPVPPVSVQVGQTVAVPVAAVATDPDGNDLVFGQLSAAPDSQVATAALAAGNLTVTGVKAGSTSFKVVVTDTKASAQVTVPVTVTAPPFTPKFSVIALSPDLNGDGRGEV